MSNIQWTDKTWNWLVGCSRVPGSPGCNFCYAAEAAKSARLQQFPQYQQVKAWDGTVEFVENQLLKPLSWKKPQRIFTCSMSDVFHENVPDEWIDKAMAVMAIAHWHTFQILTKRPQRMRDYFLRKNRFAAIDYQVYEILRNERCPYTREHDVIQLPLSNIWLGTSVENQKMAEKRIPYLLQTPAKIRFLSCEPLLEKLDLKKWLGRKKPFSQHEKLDWLIAGGESGNKARPCRVEWIHSIVRQCQDAGVACFVKQLGSKPYLGCDEYIPGINDVKLRSRKGGDPDEWPDDLKIRQHPQ